MPAALEVVGDTLDRLMKLALDGASVPARQFCSNRATLPGRIIAESSIFRHEPIHAPEEALNAFDARILPIQIAVGRRGERLYMRAASAP